MNILYIENLSSENVSSWSVHVYEVIKNLSKLGHRIILTNGNSPTLDLVPNVENNLSQPSLWTRMENKLGLFKIFRPFRGEITVLWLLLVEVKIFILTFITLLRNRFNNRRIDVIYRRHNLFSSHYLIAKLCGIGSVKEVNGIVFDESKIHNKDRLSLWIIDKIERQSIKQSDKIIVVTPELKKILVTQYHIEDDKVIVILNGANINLFKPTSIGEAKIKLGLEKSINYVCFVGALYAWQGIEDLLRSAPFVLQQHPETRFLIVGDGPIKVEMMNIAKQIGIFDKVIFTGMVSYLDVPIYINASDICIVTKIQVRTGLSPLKLYEYMACGKPVVARQKSGFDFIEKINAGILVHPEDYKEFSNAIIKLIENETLRQEMGENAKNYVVENQSWFSVAKRVANVCQDVIKTKRK
jgi:glycosyltransferase involved in cell wall biosynthesis